MQEEMQLLLDETVVTRFEKAEARLSSGVALGNIDRRDPLWRQTFFRREGVAYYSAVSLFRAGCGNSSGISNSSNQIRNDDWGQRAGQKKQRRPWDAGESDDDQEERRGGQDDENLGKLYLKFPGSSRSKEAASSYGKGDVWALSETGRFTGSDDVVFCRSRWHGVSSQGMLSICPLGDDTEAVRLGEMAGRGGGKNARTVYAVRCLNAQTDLCALDLLRTGNIPDDDAGNDDHGANRLDSGRQHGSGRTHLETIPLIRHLLSGALDTRQFVESGKNRLTSRGSDSVATVGNRGSESPFDICLAQRERDAEVLHVVEEFSLNRDQARLLWRCARWFRPSETARADQRGGQEMEAEEKEEEDQDRDACPVLLVHGVFGAGKSLSLVALCVMLDRIAAADARARPTQGLAPRSRRQQIRVLLAAGTNVAVDRVLMGLMRRGFDSIARVGSHRRTHKSLLGCVVHSSCGRDAQKAAQVDLQDMLKAAVGDERALVTEALEATKRDSFSADQALRLSEARVTGVTCASATTPLLTRFPARGVGGGGRVQQRGGEARAGFPARGRRQVFGANNRGSAGNSDGCARRYDIVLLDECSQIVEPLSLLPIAVARPERIVLVGDPMQLPPPIAHARAVIPAPPATPASPLLQECHAARCKQLVERANARRGSGDTLEKTLFVRLAALGLTPLLLGRQYRCHPRLSGLASRLFYQNRLSDGISAEDRRPLVPGLAPLTLVDAGGRSAESTSAAAGGSFLNVFEARLIADLVSGLLGAGTPSLTAASIGVICLYKAQLTEVRRHLESASRPPPRSGSPARASLGERDPERTSSFSCRPRDVQVCTVDAFQGAEKDIVIVASTRTERLGFLVSPQRLCVALTRARHHLVIVGEKKVLLTNPLWREIVETSKVAKGFADILSS
ncbi:unnamed protein product [Ascophyllum nodosum]